MPAKRNIVVYKTRYSNDPVDDFNHKQSRKPKSLLTIALAVGLIAFGGTFASNVNLGLGGNIEFGQGLLKTIACDNNGVLIKPENEMTTSSGGNSFRVSSITISDISANCTGKKFRLKFYDNNSALSLPIAGHLREINFIYSPGNSLTSDKVAIEELSSALKLSFMRPMSLASQTEKFTIESYEPFGEVQGIVDTSFASPSIISETVGRSDSGSEILIDEVGNSYLLISSRSGGTWEMVIRKYLKNGSVDSTYASSGVARFSISNNILMGGSMDRDRNIYLIARTVGASVTASIIKVSSNGSIDTGFGSAGSLTLNIPGANRSYINAIVVDKNDKPVLAGHSCVDPGICNPYIARITPEGALDNSFGLQGIRSISSQVSVYGNELVIGAKGRIYLVGDSSDGTIGDVYIYGITESGNLDGNFANVGALQLDFGSVKESGLGITSNPHGGVYISGFTTVGAQEKVLVASVTSAGILDTSFGAAGKTVFAPDSTTNYWSSSITVDDNGSIFVGIIDMTNSVRIGNISKLTSTGGLDTSFGDAGTLRIVNTVSSSDWVNDLIINQENKLLLAGNTSVSGGSTKAFLMLLK